MGAELARGHHHLALLGLGDEICPFHFPPFDAFRYLIVKDFLVLGPHTRLVVVVVVVVEYPCLTCWHITTGKVMGTCMEYGGMWLEISGSHDLTFRHQGQ